MNCQIIDFEPWLDLGPKGLFSLGMMTTIGGHLLSKGLYTFVENKVDKKVWMRTMNRNFFHCLLWQKGSMLKKNLIFAWMFYLLENCTIYQFLTNLLSHFNHWKHLFHANNCTAHSPPMAPNFCGLRQHHTHICTFHNCIMSKVLVSF